MQRSHARQVSLSRQKLASYARSERGIEYNMTCPSHTKESIFSGLRAGPTPTMQGCGECARPPFRSPAEGFRGATIRPHRTPRRASVAAGTAGLGRTRLPEIRRSFRPSHRTYPAKVVRAYGVLHPQSFADVGKSQLRGCQMMANEKNQHGRGLASECPGHFYESGRAKTGNVAPCYPACASHGVSRPKESSAHSCALELVLRSLSQRMRGYRRDNEAL